MSKKILSQKQKIAMKVCSKKHYKINKLYVLKQTKLRRIKVMKEWGNIVPKKTECAVCGKVIFFRHKKRYKTIHFDHRHGGNEPIKGPPSTWMSSNRPNERSLALFLKSDFGLLCGWCNYFIPTKDRLKWLDNLTNYIKG